MPRPASITAENRAPLSADVLVVGGGPAGTWAAIKAAQAGGDGVLVDKARCGSSGATASVGTGIWYVEDKPELREAAMAGDGALLAASTSAPLTSPVSTWGCGWPVGSWASSIASVSNSGASANLSKLLGETHCARFIRGRR
jgi:predicted oxidoreductase